MAYSEETASRTLSAIYKDVELQLPSEDVALGGDSNHRDGRTVQRQGRGSGTGRIFRFWRRKSNDAKVFELLVREILNEITGKVSDTDSSSSPASVEEKPMMAEFLADRGDYETMRSHVAASSSIPIQEAASRIAPANIVSAETTFDIGIPPEYSTADVCHPRKDHHHHVLNGFVQSLHEMLLQDEDGPLHFDEGLKTIRCYTSCLVSAVGPPLDDWNALAQLVLRVLKEREDLGVNMDAFYPKVTSSSLHSEIHSCTLIVEEEEAELKDLNERLARAREEYVSIEEKAKAMEQRVAQNLLALEQKRRQYAIIEQFESLLAKLSSFQSVQGKL